MEKYEYYIENYFNVEDSRGRRITTDTLNILGEKGWKLISVVGENMIFMREKR